MTRQMCHINSVHPQWSFPDSYISSYISEHKSIEAHSEAAEEVISLSAMIETHLKTVLVHLPVGILIDIIVATQASLTTQATIAKQAAHATQALIGESSHTTRLTNKSLCGMSSLCSDDMSENADGQMY
jgi:hypothetical protein